MARKKNEAGELAEKLTLELARQRSLGGTAYPVTLKKLIELADPQAAAEIVKKAVGSKAFSARGILASKGNDETPLALKEDLELLADSSLLLEFALGGLCSEAKPTVPVGRLKSKVAASLRVAFEGAVLRRIENGSLPPGVECLQEKRVKVLHPIRFPLPKPPTLRLAERMVAALADQRACGGDVYPVHFRRLIDLADPEAKPALIKKALKEDFFREKAGALFPKATDSPVAFQEDFERLAAGPSLLEPALRSSRTEAAQAFSVADLGRLVAPQIRLVFVAAVNERLKAGALSGGVGCVGYKKNKLLFLMEDVSGQSTADAGEARTRQSKAGQLTVQEEVPRPSAPFSSSAFDEAFQRLDRHGGGHNFVSLVDLRRTLPMDRRGFDEGLRQLRTAGVYSLSAAEGRHGISAAEREAGIAEEGALLLFVSKR